MKKKKVFIHIGLPKTGTTSIQRFLYSNADELRKYGILYPSSGLMGDAHHKLAAYFYLKSPPGILKKFVKKPYLELLKNEILESNKDIIFLSSEMFSDISNIRGLKEYFKSFGSFDISIICFLRRQDVWLESSCVEEYKTAINDNLDLVLSISKQKKYLNFNLYLKDWEKIFGVENILVGFLNDKKNSNAVSILISLLGMGGSGIELLTKKITRANERLTPECTHYSHFIHRKKAVVAKNFFPILSEYPSETGPRDKYVLFTNKQREKFLNYFRVSNSILAEKYCNGGYIFSDMDVDGLKKGVTFPAFNQEKNKKVSTYMSKEIDVNATFRVLEDDFIPNEIIMKEEKGSRNLLLKYVCRVCDCRQYVNVPFFQRSWCLCERCGIENEIFPFKHSRYLGDVFFEALKTNETIALWGVGGFFREVMSVYGLDLSSENIFLVDSDELVQGLGTYDKEIYSPAIISKLKIETVMIFVLQKEAFLIKEIQKKIETVKRILVVDYFLDDSKKAVTYVKIIKSIA